MRIFSTLIMSTMLLLVIVISQSACGTSKNLSSNDPLSKKATNETATVEEKEYFASYMQKSEEKLQSLIKKTDLPKMLADFQSMARSARRKDLDQRSRDEKLRALEITMALERDYGLTLDEVRTLGASKPPSRIMDKLNQGKAKLEKDAEETRQRLDQLRSEFDKNPKQVVERLKASDSKGSD